MIDRDKVTSVLARRFPGASPTDIAAAANAIVGLGHEYEAVDVNAVKHFDCATSQDYYTLSELAEGRIRLFRRADGEDRK